MQSALWEGVKEAEPRALSTCTDPGQRLDNHPLVVEGARRRFQDIQENLLEEDLANIPGRGRKKPHKYPSQPETLTWVAKTLKAACQRYRR